MPSYACPPLPRVIWKASPAEASGLPDHSVDAVVIAQALHWFDLETFWPEVRRVLRPGGIVTTWSYRTLDVDDPATSRLLRHIYEDVVGQWWPANRRHVENGYADLSFPFTPISPPDIAAITADLDVDHMLGYLRSWSATRHAMDALGRDRCRMLTSELREYGGMGRAR